MQIKHTVGNIRAELNIVHMTIRGGMLRSKLVADAFAHPLEDGIGQTIAVITFPKLMACLEAGTITRKQFDEEGKFIGESVQDARTLTLDEFLSLPDEIGVLWTAAVAQENPLIDAVQSDDKGRPIVTQDAEGKSLAPGRGSKPSTARKIKK